MIWGDIKEEAKRIVDKRNKERDCFFKDFVHLVEKYDNFFVFIHCNPDGDCLGAAFGFKAIIESNFLRKTVHVIGEDGGLFPWLEKKFDNLVNISFDFSQAMALIVDVGNRARIQKFDKYFEQAKTKFGAIVKVDHHGVFSDFSVDLNWDDPTYSSTCEQIVQIVDYYGWIMNKEAATFLYLGICTDGGRFLYESVLPRTLILAAKTWRSGAQKDLIHDNLTYRTWNSIKISNYLLNNCQKTDNVIWFYLTRDIQKELGIPDGRGLVNTFANIEDHWCWILFSDTAEGMVKCDFRSRDVSVRDLAIKYGGGGHINAAGASISDSKLIKNIVEDADVLVKRAKNQKIIAEKQESSSRFNEMRRKQEEDLYLSQYEEILSSAKDFVDKRRLYDFDSIEKRNKRTLALMEKERKQREKEAMKRKKSRIRRDDTPEDIKRMREQQTYNENKVTIEELYFQKSHEKLDFDKYVPFIEEIIVNILTAPPYEVKDSTELKDYLKKNKVGGDLAIGIIDSLIARVKLDES
ncbi:MgpA-like protein, DHH family phosphoesterase [Mycoplasma haemocanis str. Illinois]|uniref:MgpA-like protein, DHH family phosphoesterase n=1 Tax=Mycoplasma haemocanis (strain Illinois) TaxID=1111676 RepID=H6N8K6_MYCHN|nr:DHH family phosphoesterase [Mycoplasma haemocanis]AEW45978.1 MgpA-like protein, DHH family phosphoesterase [Mycoplasma haemocanis str. Illinois]